MNIIDAAIILIILMGAVVGFKRGFTKEIVSFLGFFIVVVLSFILKNPISVFMYEHLPFFKFGGIIKGVTVLNIALYEIIAFLIVLSVLTFILRIVMFATKIFEKILKFTIVLGIPSKLLGLVVGLIEGFVWVFIILYVLNLPVFNITELNNSKLKNKILNNVPILSSFASSTNKVINEFLDIKDKYEVIDNSNEFNKETLDLFLKYDVITIDSVDNLIANKKLIIENVDEVLDKYRKEG